MGNQRLNIIDVGNVSASPEALELLEAAEITIDDLLAKYGNGDWFNTEFDDAWNNDIAAYRERGEVVSRLNLPTGEVVYLVSLFNQTITTIMSGAEYAIYRRDHVRQA